MISRRAFFVIVVTWIAASAARAAPPDYARMSDAELIDALREIDRQAIGLHATLSAWGFLAEDAPAQIDGGVFGSATPAHFPQMRELVCRGAKALPELLRHLDDARPTRFTVRSNIFPIEWGMFAAEYDPRRRGEKAEAEPPSEKDQKAEESGQLEIGRGIFGAVAQLPYTVTVGDVCYVLIGQLVNRRLTAVRYQPSGGVLIASPVRDPALAVRVRRDWAGVTEEELKRSLIRDAIEVPGADDALVRLRFFYPDEYRKQRAGELKTRIDAFELKAKKN